MSAVDETHRRELTSWVASAQAPGTAFPIQNLPFGVYRRAHGAPRVGVGIGDQIVDVARCVDEGLLDGDAARACRATTLNTLMSVGREPMRELRRALSALLRQGSPVREHVLVPMSEAELVLPADIGDYTDFYASLSHATNVGRMFRPDNPLLPNYKWVPIGYHGRASSIVVSGTSITRPVGQSRAGTDGPPTVGPSRRLDYELEVGVFVGPGNALGSPIAISDAERHMFGLCLVNDWSARDIQAWEYQPLGPFLAKSFATTVSPWVITLDALEPFRAPAYARAPDDPRPLPHLTSPADADRGGFDITLEVSIASERMRREGIAPMRVSTGSFTEMYWTLAQLLTHHASNGCNLRPADLLASGTVSGPAEESRGCLLERTSGGQNPLTLPTSETRAFLEDGDEVVLSGYCERAGFARIGFGECRGVVLSSRA